MTKYDYDSNGIARVYDDGNGISSTGPKNASLTATPI